MAAIIYPLFIIIMTAIVVGVFAERAVIMRRLGKVRNSRIKLAYTEKARKKMIEDYRLECTNGHKDVWYKYLFFIQNYGMRVVYLTLFLGIVGFLLKI